MQTDIRILELTPYFTREKSRTPLKFGGVVGNIVQRGDFGPGENGGNCSAYQGDFRARATAWGKLGGGFSSRNA